MKKLLSVAAGFLIVMVLILLGVDLFVSSQKPSFVVTPSLPEKKVSPSPSPLIDSNKETVQEPDKSSVTPSDQEANSSLTSVVPTPSVDSDLNLPQEPGIRSAQIKLRDGSTIVGDVFLDKLKFQTPYGDLNLTLKNFLEIQDNMVKMRDGSVFIGDFLTKTIKVKTKQGELYVDLEKVASLKTPLEDTPSQEVEAPKVAQESISFSAIEEKMPPVSDQIPSSKKENKIPEEVADKPSAPEKEKEPTKGIVAIKAGNLNVREGSGETFKVITKLKKGEEIEILESSNGWYKVKLPTGQTGYVATRFIKLKK